MCVMNILCTFHRSVSWVCYNRKGKILRTQKAFKEKQSLSFTPNEKRSFRDTSTNKKLTGIRLLNDQGELF